MAAWCCLTPVAAVLSGHFLSAGWAWDFLNSLGFVALAGVVFLAFQGRIKTQRKIHQLLSYFVLTVLSAHVIGLLLIDSTIIEYLKPQTPWYMSVGIAAYLLFVLTLILALPKLRFSGFNNSAGFRTWHRLLGWLLILLSALHVIGAGYYLRHWYQYALLSSVLIPLVFASRIQRSLITDTASLLPIISTMLAAGALLTVALNIPSS